MLKTLLALALFGASLCCAKDPADDPEIQKTLRAMKGISTWWHPDMFGMTAGMRAYAHHEYPNALKYFEIGAFYGDKLSQLSIGLMHENGEGTDKDPVAAYAWIDLASERHYPQFEATRDELKKSMSSEQLDQARVLRAELSKKYGDAVAKPRMAVQLKQGMMEITGSRTGFDSGVQQARPELGCGPTLTIGGHNIPQPGCPGADLYAKDNWIPDLYFAARDREWKPSVTVGPISEPGSSSADSKPSEDIKSSESAQPKSH